MSGMVNLRPYQVEIGRAVMDSVLNERGLTFTVEIARQGGKNELSAQMEVLLLAMFAAFTRLPPLAANIASRCA